MTIIGSTKAMAVHLIIFGRSSHDGGIVFEWSGGRRRSLGETANHVRFEIQDIGHPVVKVNACHCVGEQCKRVSVRISTHRLRRHANEGVLDRECD